MHKPPQSNKINVFYLSDRRCRADAHERFYNPDEKRDKEKEGRREEDHRQREAEEAEEKKRLIKKTIKNLTL